MGRRVLEDCPPVVLCNDTQRTGNVIFLVNPLKLHSFSGKAPHSEAYPCLLIVIVTDLCVKRYFFVIKYRYAFRERKQLKYYWKYVVKQVVINYLFDTQSYNTTQHKAITEMLSPDYIALLH